jgi:hypothetical protein
MLKRYQHLPLKGTRSFDCGAAILLRKHTHPLASAQDDG